MWRNGRDNECEGDGDGRGSDRLGDSVGVCWRKGWEGLR